MITLLSTGLGGPAPSRAEEPDRLESGVVACALRRAGLERAPDFGERALKAPLVPRLALGARTVELAVPGVSLRSVEVFAWVRWPLERRGTRGIGDLGPLSARRQQLATAAAARARTLSQLEARPRAGELRDQIDDELDREEARAELDAIGAEGCR